MSEGPVRSGSSVYFERYGRAEQYAAAMRSAVYALAAACIVLAAGLVMLVSRPRAIHYISASSPSGMSYPGRVPFSSAMSFAVAWLMDWMNYSPGTVEDVYERAIVFMAPSFQAKVRAGLEEELSRIARDKLASVFTLSMDPQIEESGGGFRVVLVGERGIYVGKEEMSREMLRFTVDVRSAYPTESNPYGLVISDVMKEKELR